MAPQYWVWRDDTLLNPGGLPLASDFADAVAVLNGMGGLLWARTTDVAQGDAEKIGRAILKATQNAEKAFQSCRQK